MPIHSPTVLASMLIWQKSICKENVKMNVALEISAHIITNRAVTLVMWCFPIYKCSHSVWARFHVILIEIHRHYPHRNGAQSRTWLCFAACGRSASLFSPFLFLASVCEPWLGISSVSACSSSPVSQTLLILSPGSYKLSTHYSSQKEKAPWILAWLLTLNFLSKN